MHCYVTISNIFSLIMAGLYVHIPFCKSRCIYCDFYSTTKPILSNRYTDCLLHEMDLRKNYLREDIQTLYLGGGTPSQLPPECIEKLLHSFGVANETTMECNPDDITPTLANIIADLGINRVSMGAQTFSDRRLSFIKRRHTSRQVKEAVTTLRNAGIHNISIDLMYGFPNETMEEWEYDINEALKLDVQHISAYSLIYEEGTPLYELREKGIVKEVDEEISRRMYSSLIDKLEHSGFEHYEISNFAKQGFRSKHNSSYWLGTPYLGLGAAAHSFDGDSRQWNIADIYEYMDSIEKDIIPCNKETLTNETKYNEYVMTRLRTSDGIDLQELRNKFGDKMANYCIQSATPILNNGNLSIDNGTMKLTKDSIFISDDIISDLIFV